MYKIYLRYLFIILLLPLITTSCAWENIPEDAGKSLRLSITMRVSGQIDPNLFYFIVFNFSGDPNKKPEPYFEGEKRGKFWTAYYMYGNPRLTGHNFYKGVGGKTDQGANKLDLRPVPSTEILEFVPTSVPTPGASPTGNEIRLELDFGKVTLPPKVSMNMMVSSLPFDRVDNPNDQFDAFIYDSFLFNGITLNFDGTKTDFNETEFKLEETENIGENPPPNANITYWRVLILQ